MASTAIVDPALGVFCEDGMKDGRIVVKVPRNPDPRTDRYSGDPLNPIRSATAQELADVDAAAADALINAQFNSKAGRALLLTAMWFALGHQPTAQEAATAKTRFAAIFKSLP